MRSAACCSSRVDGGGVQTQMRGQLVEIPPLAVEHLLVGADDREGERVEVLAHARVGDAGGNLGQRPRRVELGRRRWPRRRRRAPAPGWRPARAALSTPSARAADSVRRSDPEDLGADARARPPPWQRRRHDGRAGGRQRRRHDRAVWPPGAAPAAPSQAAPGRRSPADWRHRLVDAPGQAAERQQGAGVEERRLAAGQKPGDAARLLALAAQRALDDRVDQLFDVE